MVYYSLKETFNLRKLTKNMIFCFLFGGVVLFFWGKRGGGGEGEGVMQT